MYTCYAGDVFAVIAEPKNHEGVSYYLLRCTAERTKLYDLEESDRIFFPIGKLYTYMYACTYMNKYIYLGNFISIKF